MEKETKTRTICMNCLHSIITTKHESDPKNARLVVMWSCPKCENESTDVEFYNYQMGQIILE